MAPRTGATFRVAIHAQERRNPFAESGGELRENLALRCYANEADFAGVYACELEAELAARGRTLDLVERPGDHSFADYAANSSVSEAFEFVLERLRDC